MGNIANAMKRDYSVLLIEDLVLKDSGESVNSAQMDLLMMLLLGGAERSRKQFHSLLASVSPPLEIVEVWRAEGGDNQSVVEVKLK